jgi:hypothetical protein
LESLELDEVIICGLCDEHLDDEDDMIWHYINKHRFELSIEISDDEIEDYIKEFGGELSMGGGTEQ